LIPPALGIGAVVVAVRWVAPETYGHVFTLKGDVWSYGVTLWEVFSNGETPYAELPVGFIQLRFI
jgi:serine/threonine protein kinase